MLKAYTATNVVGMSELFISRQKAVIAQNVLSEYINNNIKQHNFLVNTKYATVALYSKCI